MVTITAFADEISSDLNEQLDVLASVGISHLEFRGVWRKNVLDLTNEELKTVKTELDARGFQVSSIGSPIGKINITDPFEPHLERMKRALDSADYLGAPFIRIFSFFIPADEPVEVYREQVMFRMGELVKLAEKTGKVLLHENEKHIYGDHPSRCRDILSTVNSPVLRGIWDPANYIQCGVDPYQEGFLLTKEYVEYIHIKDALKDSGKVVPAGLGDGQIAKVFQELKQMHYSGFLSIEPHLKSAGIYDGFSGPDLFRTAAHALRDLVEQNGWTWN
ncbi:MAG: sugar phosphate isomerase/epimerase [Bacilli bacterium]|nr:sugar phosphate isomerase/epimerase [Bacilli bacterium]